MKLACLFLVLASGSSFAQSVYKNILRQNPQGSGVVWDMPVAANGVGPSALLLETGGSLFQLWTIDQTKVVDYLLDQKLVGAYLPKAEVNIVTLDSYAAVKSTRVDQPFSVEFQVYDLLTGTGLPLAATKVLTERHIADFPTGVTSLDAAAVAANTPTSSAYIAQNGKTVMKFGASALTASPDPTKATGEEHFVVHALSDGTFTQTQIASDKVMVHPVASGEIFGLTQGKEYRFTLPTVQVNFYNLYPRSKTYFVLSGDGGMVDKAIIARPWDDPRQTLSKTYILDQGELDKAIIKDGAYTVSLFSDTVYGREELAKPISFRVRRTMEVNAMQVGFTDTTQH